MSQLEMTISKSIKYKLIHFSAASRPIPTKLWAHVTSESLRLSNEFHYPQCIL